MGYQKGHWGEYSGNAKWSKDHAHTKVTKENYKASVKDDAGFTQITPYKAPLQLKKSVSVGVSNTNTLLDAIKSGDAKTVELLSICLLNVVSFTVRVPSAFVLTPSSDKYIELLPKPLISPVIILFIPSLMFLTAILLFNEPSSTS